ncbi:uncharacterized protein LOC106654861 [Trichogramma pretiosum]|uniref:uncharacterized protein LOC106654861 n=1 Tax=Trichogramma pretiosum TaxID=7493 RepID=UPI0006C9C507|nr:uncharacterized protein LOC106654861 [Trichogramma pretiosum]
MTSDDKIPLLNESMSEDDRSFLDQSMSEETSQWDRSMSEEPSTSVERKPITVQPRAQEVRISVGIERGRANITNERQNDENRRFINDQVHQALRIERVARRLERKRQEADRMNQFLMGWMPACIVRPITYLTLKCPDYTLGLCICGLGVLFMVVLVILILISPKGYIVKGPMAP